jgi:D-tyrosyl-tRNA(Tyr) deacylase
MKIVVQRARQGEVRVNGEIVGSLPSPGLVLLVGITHDDTLEKARKLAAKVWGLRILHGPDGITPQAWSRGDVSASQVNAPLLVVSQFTLYADLGKGRRPSFDKAAKGDVAQPLFRLLCRHPPPIGRPR